MDPLSISAAVAALGGAVKSGLDVFGAVKSKKKSTPSPPAPDRIPIEDVGYMRDIAALSESSTYIAQALSSQGPRSEALVVTSGGGGNYWGLVIVTGAVLLFLAFRR